MENNTKTICCVVACVAVLGVLVYIIKRKYGNEGFGGGFGGGGHGGGVGHGHGGHWGGRGHRGRGWGNWWWGGGAYPGYNYYDYYPYDYYYTLGPKCQQASATTVCPPERSTKIVQDSGEMGQNYLCCRNYW